MKIRILVVERRQKNPIVLSGFAITVLRHRRALRSVNNEPDIGIVAQLFTRVMYYEPGHRSRYTAFLVFRYLIACLYRIPLTVI